MPARPTKTVAVFNASDDTVALLIEVLTLRGHHAVGGSVDSVKSGQSDLLAFLDAHAPDAMIWDISPPYDWNWTFAKLVQAVLNVHRCAMVVTTTNTQQLNKAIGEDAGAIEIVGKPYDIEAIADRVDKVIEQMSASGLRALERP